MPSRFPRGLRLGRSLALPKTGGRLVKRSCRDDNREKRKGISVMARRATLPPILFQSRKSMAFTAHIG